MAVFEEDEQEMRLLYSSIYRSSRRAVNSETQWILMRGRNPGIKAPLNGQWHVIRIRNEREGLWQTARLLGLAAKGAQCFPNPGKRAKWDLKGILREWYGMHRRETHGF
jgi:hypothetical protein